MTVLASIWRVFYIEGNDGFWVSLFWLVMAGAFTFFGYKASAVLPRWIGSYLATLERVRSHSDFTTGTISVDAELDIEEEVDNHRTGSAARWRQRWLIFCVIAATFSWCCFLFST